MKSFKNFLDQTIDENFRHLAQKGIGAESKSEIKVGHGVDYYHPKSGDKHMGKIHSMSDKGYVVKDDKSGEKHSFDYYRKEEIEHEDSKLDEASYEGKGNHRPGWMLRADPELAKKFKEKTDAAKLRQKYMGKTSDEIAKMKKEDVELGEADFSKSQTVMAHTIGKEFKKKGVGDSSKGGPFAVASAMVRDRPSAAKKAYATIKAKTKNEDYQDVLMALYDELNEDNREIFEDMLDSNPEKLLSFAMSQVPKE